MKILVIDSHKGTSKQDVQNLHWQNAKAIADHLGAKLIWSYDGVNDEIESDFDAIVFVHASHYSYTDLAWIDKSPNAKLFYVTNEYNLGEPRTLWSAAKCGRRYTVIANHEGKISKVVKKYVDDWKIINLNALAYKGKQKTPCEKSGCIYWGNFRKDRSKHFLNYLNGIVVSTSKANVQKFKELGISTNFVGRVDWNGRGVMDYATSLYIEDEVTHDNYNHLANRFYESLDSDTTPLFDVSCWRTVQLSGYEIPDDFFVCSVSELKKKTENRPEIPESWREVAAAEKRAALDGIKRIVCQD